MDKRNPEKDISSLDTVLMLILLLPWLSVHFSSTGLTLTQVTSTHHSDNSL